MYVDMYIYIYVYVYIYVCVHVHLSICMNIAREGGRALSGEIAWRDVARFQSRPFYMLIVGFVPVTADVPSLAKSLGETSQGSTQDKLAQSLASVGTG